LVGVGPALCLGQLVGQPSGFRPCLRQSVPSLVEFRAHLVGKLPRFTPCLFRFLPYLLKCLSFVSL